MYGPRTKETHERYQEVKQARLHTSEGCQLCKEQSLLEFTHWRIIHAGFPYDRIADVHDLLLTKAHKTELELTEEERTELQEIKLGGALDEHYAVVWENLKDYQSIPAHFHLHLLKLKDEI